ncbi:MAG TPA: TIGR02679 family protein [Marmoricola sp.]|nr:TIGR02679 family protein [Marmoricola sp.]
MTVDPTAASDRIALDRLLGVPEMAWLLARVRPRVSASRGSTLAGVVQLDHPTDAQRAAAVRLVGRPRRTGSTLRVELADVEAILRRGPWPPGLADAVETLTGPVVDHAAERDRETTAWAEAAEGLRDGAARFAGLGDWWEEWCASGGLKRAARAEAARTGAAHGPGVGADLVELVAAVLATLPSAGEPLPVLARRVTGDAHALDASRPLGRLAAAAVEVAFAPAALSSRDAWAAAGVVLSNVASTVLCLGVPGETGTTGSAARATASALAAMRTARMPLVLTLDQVRSGGVAPLTPDRVIHVCENPTIVEVVADRWGRSAAPAAPVLICTWGQPSTAVVNLLTILTARGAGCRYHGDFDWPGLRIAQALHQRIPWTPWRYTAADYVAVVEGDPLSRALAGRPALSPWDPKLSMAMAEHGLAVEEEAVAEMLANDLVTGHDSG